MGRNTPWPPVIAAVWDPKELGELPAASRHAVAFLLGGGLRNVASPTREARRRGWRVYVHVDMVRGLAPSEEGLAFLREFAEPDGVISTHAQTIAQARHLGFEAVQRIFMLDSRSLATGIAQARTGHPTAVEAMPGLLVDVIARLARDAACPVIAGGLVTRRDEVDRLLAAGAASVSTSHRDLWGYVPTAWDDGSSATGRLAPKP